MFLILLAVVCLLTGATLALYLNKNRNQIIASLISQGIAFILVMIAAIPALLSGEKVTGLIHWSFPVNDINLCIDPLSAFFLIFSIPMTLLGSIYAMGYLAPSLEKKRMAGSHFALLNMVSLSYILIYTVQNAIVFLLGWELAALSAWLLVIWEYKNQKIRFAGFNYLVSTHVGLLFLIAAFMLLHSAAGSFDFATFDSVLGQSGHYRNIIFILLITSFGLKSAFFPFHTWLPRAHSAAPAHISALMSGVIHKAGIYGILRFTLHLGNPEEWMGWYLIGFSCLSTFMGALYTITQRDIKRLLGYSSTENVGIAGIGIGVGYLGITWNSPLMTAFGFTGAILHVLNHALFKCLLFYAAGCIYRMTHTVDLERLGGLIKKMPYTAGYYLLGGLAISALPPFNGFVSEFLIYNGLLRDWHTQPLNHACLIIFAAILSLVGAISAIAIVRSFGISFLGQARDNKIEVHGEAPISMRIPMALHAAGVIILGMFPIIGLYIAVPVAQQFLAAPDPLEILFETLAPICKINGLIVFTTATIWLIQKLLLPSKPRPHVTWACGYNAVNTRMQYTGSAFSDPIISVFRGLLRLLKKEILPRGIFPTVAYLNTHFVDAIERRMFRVIGEGESIVEIAATQAPEESRVSFMIGLFVILIVVSLLLAKSGVI